jgi:hypothetical protein
MNEIAQISTDARLRWSASDEHKNGATPLGRAAFLCQSV